MTPDLDTIVELRKAATPGPWRRTILQAGTGSAAFGRAVVNAEESGYPGAMLEGIRAEVDAAFIAAAGSFDFDALQSRLAVLEGAASSLLDELHAAREGDSPLGGHYLVQAEGRLRKLLTPDPDSEERTP